MTESLPTPAATPAEVGLLFLRLGTTAFGGPAAHLALFEDEVVRRRRWITRAEFLDMAGAANLIPGPNSTELAIHIGRRVAGWPGFFLGGLGFILPSTLMVMALAWAYVRFGSLPQVEGILYGIKPVMLAIVLQALARLGRTALRSPRLAVLAAASLSANAAGLAELPVLLVAGLIALAVRTSTTTSTTAPGDRRMFLPALGAATATTPWSVGMAAGASATTPFGLWPLFWFFLRTGSVLYGSGYVLLAFLRTDLVERWRWLTEAQLLDAIAAGQMTPGPLFTTATFVGYLLGGPWAALLATVGIFLPAFVFVAISGPLIPRLRASPRASAFLDGVNVASLAVMAVVTVRLGSSAVIDLPTALIAAAGAVLLLAWRVNSTWLVAAGAAVGLACHLLHASGGMPTPTGP